MNERPKLGIGQVALNVHNWVFQARQLTQRMSASGSRAPLATRWQPAQTQAEIACWTNENFRDAPEHGRTSATGRSPIGSFPNPPVGPDAGTKVVNCASW